MGREEPTCWYWQRRVDAAETALASQTAALSAAEEATRDLEARLEASARSVKRLEADARRGADAASAEAERFSAVSAELEAVAATLLRERDARREAEANARTHRSDAETAEREREVGVDE